VADEQHRDVARLGEPRDPIGDLAHLPDRARRARQVGGVQRLHRVDHHDLGPLRIERREHGVQVGLGEHRDLQRRAGQPLGPQLDLRRALLAGDVERAPAGAGQVAERHRCQRRLADARRAAQQHERAGHQPAPEDAVELPDAGEEPGDLDRLDVGEADRAGGGACAVTGVAAAASLCRGCPGLLRERVPLAAARAAAVPFRLLVAAGGAGEHGRRAGHRGVGR
jgi:hypothetical protein